MIRVNGINSINFVTRPNFKAENTEALPLDKVAEQPKKLNGAQALAAYNIGLIKEEKCVLNPLEPINTDVIDGEKIYTSDGKLHSIIKEDDDKVTIFTPYEDNENTIESVVIKDKNTGNVILRQNNYEDGNGVSITEYSPETGKKLRHTSYEDGKLDYTSITEYGENDEQTYQSYRNWSKSFSILKEKNDDYLEATFDKDMQLSNVTKHQKVKHREITTSAEFYNGGMYKISKSEEILIPNVAGREKFNDPDFKAAEKFDGENKLLKAKGERTYYSNDALETIKNDEMCAKFNPDGSLSEVEFADKKITNSENGVQEIEEKLEDDKTRITTYLSDGYYVEIKDGDKYKEVHFNKDGKPISYHEGTINDEGENDSKLSLYYSDKELLDWAYKY